MARRNKNNTPRKEAVQAAAIEKAAQAAQAQQEAQPLDEEQLASLNRESAANLNLRESSNINISLGGSQGNSEDPNRSPYQATENNLNIKTAGALLRYHRQRAGISINDVAAKLKVRTTTIADIEGDRVCDSYCGPYMSQIIGRYADYLHIDRNTVIDMYEQNIAENVKISRKNQAKKKASSGSYSSLYMMIVVLMIAIATGGYFVFGGKQKSEQVVTGAIGESSEHSTLDYNDVDSSEPMVGGVLNQSDSLSESSLENTSTTDSVVIEDENNKYASELNVVDENTARATAQAEALQKDMSQSNEQAQSVTPQSLELDSGTNISVDHNAAPEIRTNSLIEMPTEVASASVQAAKDSKDIVAAAAIAQQESKTTNASSKAQASSTKTENNNNNNAEQAKAKSASAPKLSANLKDVTANVSVINREGLASLNAVEIRFVKDADFKLTDGTNKVKHSGVYTKGKSIKLTGIPPFKISVTDTTAIKISYMGGSVAMPNAKQVKFELPMR